MKFKISRYNKGIAGFSLIELAVVIAITSIMLFTSIFVLRIQSDYYNVTTSQVKLSTLTLVLQTYNEKYGFYPCPAPLNAISGADGTAATNCTTCSGVYGPNPYYCTTTSKVVIGAIPFETLGLPRQMSFDSWNKKIMYIIDNRYTTGQCQGNGTIQIIDQNNSLVSNSAIYALISTGFDGKGGYNADGNITKACNTLALDGQNCAFTVSQANFNNIFRTSAINVSNIINTQYDDVITWQTNSNLTFCPAQVGSCILWMDGADICALTTNVSNQVTTWLDKSPSNLIATVPLSSNAPAFTNTPANLLNKNPYLTFNAANSNLLSLAGSFSALPQTNFTEIIVFRTSSTAIAAITAAAQGGNFTSTADRQFGPIASGQIGFVMQGGSQINSSATYTNGKAHIAAITVDSTAGETMFVDGVQVVRGIQNSSTLVTNSFLIGGHSAWAYYTGDIMEIVVYNKVLSGIERKTVETYLATKWGIPY